MLGVRVPPVPPSPAAHRRTTEEGGTAARDAEVSGVENIAVLRKVEFRAQPEGLDFAQEL